MPPMFASVLDDAPGWVLIISAIGIVVTPIVTLVLTARRDSAKDRREEEKDKRDEERRQDQLERERVAAEKVEAVRVQAVEAASKVAEAAKDVREVKTTLETNTARTDSKLDEIHSYVNSALEEAQRIYAAKCRDAANDKPSPVNLAEADRAEAVYEAHRAQTEKMERNKRTTAMDIATAAAVPVPQQNTGPITSAELKRDIADVPEKVANELDQRKQSPPEKAP